MEDLKEFHVEKLIEKVKAKKDTIHYENLCFEGGGIKGLAYLGAVQLLEELGVLQKCKRFAGTSAGAITAALLSVRTPIEDIRAIAESRIDLLLLDGSWWSALYNVLYYFGFYPANGLEKLLRDALQKQTGNGNITFLQVYKQYGTELCIVGTNLTMQTVEYFHPKTTPDVPIVNAIKCSMAIPVLIQPPIVKTNTEVDQSYIDGGVLENYPLRVYDGWYLSLKTHDSFLHKFGQFTTAFDGVNSKTLGFILYSGDEVEFQGSTRVFNKGKIRVPRPDTSLARERTKTAEENIERFNKNMEIIGACDRFRQALENADVDSNEVIAKDEFQNAIRQVCEDDINMIFGSEADLDKILKLVDKDGDNSISIREFFQYVNAHCGIRLRMIEEGGSVCTVNSFGSYVGAFMNTLANYGRRNTFKDGDWKRTVPIFVDYIGTQDFELEDGDRMFLRKQGALALLRFLAEEDDSDSEHHHHKHHSKGDAHDHAGHSHDGHEHEL